MARNLTISPARLIQRISENHARLAERFETEGKYEAAAREWSGAQSYEEAHSARQAYAARAADALRRAEEVRVARVAAALNAGLYANASPEDLARRAIAAVRAPE